MQIAPFRPLALAREVRELLAASAASAKTPPASRVAAAYAKAGGVWADRSEARRRARAGVRGA